MAPSPAKQGLSSTRRDLEVAGGNKDPVANTLGGVHPLRLRTQAGKSLARRGLTQALPTLVGELGCAEARPLYGAADLSMKNFSKRKRKKEALSSCLGNSPGVATYDSPGFT